jgi:type I restriction enzyme S subunit
MVNGKLPDGWSWLTLGEATQINPRDVSLRTLPDDLTVTFLPMAAVDAWQGIIAEPEVRPLKSVRKGFTAFSDGDVLFAKITPSMENGKAAIAKNLENGIGFGSTEFHVFRPKENVTANWIFHFIRQEHFRKDAKAHFAGTAGQLRVPASFLIYYPIPLPPLPEQERIVAKIEELFTQLEAGTSGLERVQAGLRRYKASVLKAAVSGKLVGAQGMRPSGRTPSARTGELPEGWRLVKAEEVCDFITKGTTPKANKLFSGAGDVPFIKVYNLTFDGSLDFSINPTFVSTETHKGELARSKVLPNDVLMNIVGPPLGKVSIVPNTYPEWNMNQAIARFRTLADCDPKYMAIVLMSDSTLSWATKRAKATAGQFNLTLEICRELPIPLPPLEEQRRIVAEVERRLSVAREVEAIVEAALVRFSRLRQAVLKSAFEGRL